MRSRTGRPIAMARRLALSAFMSLLPIACFAEPVEDPVLTESIYTGVSFDYSREPQKTVLFISSSGMHGGQRTIELRGDGQLVFQTLYGDEVAEEQSIRLSDEQVQTILRQVVDYGLAEWDLTRIQARQLERTNGRLFRAIPEDAVRDTILISLENYERGDYRVEKLERKVRFRGASIADRLYPEILEIKGIVELKRVLRELADRREHAT